MIPLHNAKCYWKNIYTHTSSGIPCLEVHKWILHTFPAFPDLHRNPPPNIWLKAWHFSPLHCLARNVLMFSRRDSAAYSSPLLSFFFFFFCPPKGKFHLSQDKAGEARRKHPTWGRPRLPTSYCCSRTEPWGSPTRSVWFNTIIHKPGKSHRYQIYRNWWITSSKKEGMTGPTRLWQTLFCYSGEQWTYKQRSHANVRKCFSLHVSLKEFYN